MAEVSRILEQGTACHESTEAMTDKIAHAASLTHLPSLDSGDGRLLGSLPVCACYMRYLMCFKLCDKICPALHVCRPSGRDLQGGCGCPIHRLLLCMLLDTPPRYPKSQSCLCPCTPVPIPMCAKVESHLCFALVQALRSCPSPHLLVPLVTLTLPPLPDKPLVSHSASA